MVAEDKRRKVSKSLAVPAGAILGYLAAVTVFTLVLGQINAACISFGLLFSVVSGLMTSIALGGSRGLSLIIGWHGTIFLSSIAASILVVAQKTPDPRAFLLNVLASFVSFSYLYSFLVVLISIRWVKRRHCLGSELYLYCSERHRLGARPLDLRGLRIWISPVPYPYRNYNLTVAGLSKGDAEAMLETTAWYVTCAVQVILIATIFIIPPLANVPFMSYTIYTALLSFIFISLQRKTRDRQVEICTIAFVALLTIATFLGGDTGAILRIIDMAILIYAINRYLKLPSRPLYELRFGRFEAH